MEDLTKVVVKLQKFKEYHPEKMATSVCLGVTWLSKCLGKDEVSYCVQNQGKLDL